MLVLVFDKMIILCCSSVCIYLLNQKCVLLAFINKTPIFMTKNCNSILIKSMIANSNVNWSQRKVWMCYIFLYVHLVFPLICHLLNNQCSFSYSISANS